MAKGSKGKKRDGAEADGGLSPTRTTGNGPLGELTDLGEGGLTAGGLVEEMKETGGGGRPVGARLSFHERDVQIPVSPDPTRPSQSGDTLASSDEPSIHPKRSMLRSIYSSVLGTSNVSQLQRSLSNTINFSHTSRVDMSVFQQKRIDSWIQKGVTVATNNLSYFVTPRSQPLCRRGPETRKALLKHITIRVEAGEVAYVMGPSGAGKSTLLDVLACRVMAGVMSGQVYFNSKPPAEDFFENSAYVRQDDVHIPTLTVDETLRFAARLRVGEDYSTQERELRVNSVIDLLGLTACRNSMVGDSQIRGISGGQMKRLSIAVEILNMPSLIFLDEPTSGLDSVMAHEVMSFSARLAEQNRTIIATIHQPSHETFKLASKVILVSSGRLAYCGPSAEVQAYFTSPTLGFSSVHHTNPAEFVLAVVSGAETSTNPALIGGGDAIKFAELFENSSYHHPPMIKPNPEVKAWRRVVKLPERFPRTVRNQSIVLLHRFWLTQSRQKEFVSAQIIKNIVVAAVCGTIFWMQGKKPATQYFSSSSFNVSSLYYFAMLYTILACMQIIPQLFFYRVLYTRERASHAYSTFAYWLANALVNIPLLLVSHVVFMEISYWLVGLVPQVYEHLYALLVTFLNHLVAFYCAQYIAAVAPSPEIALAVFPLFFLFLGSFAGFTIPLGLLPKGWKWASYVSFPRWTYEGLVINEFRHRLDNQATLDFYSFGGFNKWYIVPILCGFILAANVLVYCGLLPRKSKVVIEEGTLPQDSPSRKPVVVIDPTISSPSVLQLKDFQVKSSNRIPATQGMNLVFKDLQYSIGNRPDRATRILKGVSGRVNPGQMCALMGGSGAGKSTLLDLLAYRKTAGFITGEYYINGKAEKPKTRWYSYVTQDNVHIPIFTVYETLKFAAMLRLEEGMSRARREQRARDVMVMLGLDEVEDVVVGNHSLKGISGGQARRLSIGVEIVQLPDVIFLDEPTTGLDSQISYEVMASVRNICNVTRTVVCTIHSPAEQVFNLFDSLILLALGRQTYFGPAKEAVKYFAQPAINFSITPGQNPADFAMQASQAILSTPEGHRHTIRDLSRVFVASEHYSGVDRALDSVASREGDGEEGKICSRRVRANSVLSTFQKEDHPRSLLSLVGLLAYRQLVKFSKMRSTIIYTLTRNVVVGLFHGTLYMNLSPDAIQSRLSLLFFAIMFVMMANQSFIPNIFDDRLLMYRERGAGIYGSFPFWLSSCAPYIPMCLAATLSYSSIVYYLTGLQPDADRFGYFAVVVMLTSLCGLFFCQLISLLVASTQISVSIFPAALFIVVAFAGFVVRLPYLPKFLSTWAPTISFARWAFQGLVINEFEGNSRIDYASVVTQDKLEEIMRDPTASRDPYTIFIKEFGFDGFNKWDALPYLVISVAVLFVMCYFPLRFVSFEKR